MEWRDEGFILSVRPHSETNAIVEVLSRHHGRYLGLVRGGVSRRQRPALQIGNVVSAEWRARLSEHLGVMKVELMTAHAARAMDDPIGLAALSSLCALLRLLPERDPHPGLYEASLVVLDHLSDEDIWPRLMVRWEVELLNDLGFGLDLTACAGGGSADNLRYVSPKSGRAVSAAAGEPFKDKLLPLPAFLSPSGGQVQTVSRTDIAEGMELTGYFFSRHIFGPRGLDMPDSRIRLIEKLRRG